MASVKDRGIKHSQYQAVVRLRRSRCVEHSAGAELKKVSPILYVVIYITIARTRLTFFALKKGRVPAEGRTSRNLDTLSAFFQAEVIAND